MSELFSTGDAVRLVTAFDAGNDGLASKSRELTLLLLEQTASPFSRDQFTPGHITCTALVFHPSEPRVLLMHHHRLHRWLLPGGHVEKQDFSLASAAAREASEETLVELNLDFAPFLAGLDVHGIPAKKTEPYHLHHDLIWCFRAAHDRIQKTDEAPEVCWFPEVREEADWDRMGIAVSIRRTVHRARDRFLYT